MNRKITGLTCLFLAAPLMGESASDLLLGPGAKPTTTSKPIVETADYKLTDPFTTQLFVEWQSQQQTLPYEVNLWVRQVFSGEYRRAAHLWAEIQKHVPDKFLPAAKATISYLHWKLGVPQTFFNEWVNSLSQESYRNSAASIAFEKTIEPEFDAWWQKNHLSITQEQAAILKSVPRSRGMMILTLQAWLELRGGENALAILEALPPGHFLKFPLARTVTLAYAKKKDLPAVAQILKTHIEPLIEGNPKANPETISEYYIHIARFLYQAGQLDASENFYKKIPSKSEHYFAAQEELAWIRLRKGEVAKLRGELVSLTSNLYKDQFVPEAFVALAISNLKLCYYDQVDDTIRKYVEHHQPWAKGITQALSPESPSRPLHPDEFTLASEHRQKTLEEENKTLEVLRLESIAAALPAVGVQSHWEKAKQRVEVALDLAKKETANEYRRQWKNDQRQLEEANRKMQFVRVEYLAQLKSAVPEGSVAFQITEKKPQVKDVIADGTQVFPFDGVIWPDEVMKLRSLATARCLGEAKP